MGTISAAFAAKIKNLNGYYLRLLYGTLPQPSSADVITTLSSIVQTLQSILKEVPFDLLDILKHVEKDHIRLGLFPNLDYKGLYNGLMQLLDVCPLIQTGLEDLCLVFLQCLGFLMPFLDRDSLNTLPYLVAYSLSIFPVEVNKEIIEYLAFYILPFTVDVADKSYVLSRVNLPAVLMMVFQYCESLSYQRVLLECLMALHRNLVEDVLCVISYGTSFARLAAIRSFLCYWPTFSSSLYERRALIPDDVPSYPCQSKMCNTFSSVASKICYNMNISVKYSTGKPGPLYVCSKCAYDIQREQSTAMHDLLHYVQMGSVFCENKNCRAEEKEKAIVCVCFSLECASRNNNYPIHYCKQCHKTLHVNNSAGASHVVHLRLPEVWNMEPVMRTYLVESIVSLLKEARPSTPEVPKDLTDLQSKAAYFNVMTEINMMSIDDRQLMGRFGVWLLIGLCKPKADTPKDVVGRLLSILFHWFHVTAYSFDDQAECTLEELKAEHVRSWLSEVNITHFSVFISCLLPFPEDYMRVSGHWDMWLSCTLHLKNGLNRLFSLVPYELITQEVWNSVMPYWLDAVTNAVPLKELNHFKMLFSKILDPDMSSLGFDTKRLYQFVAVRFKNTTINDLEQTLSWLQVLTLLEIPIPMHMLFSFLENAVSSLITIITKTQKQERRRKSSNPNIRRKSLKPDEDESKGDPDIRCCVLVLDITLKQIKLHNIDRYLDARNTIVQDISRILKETLSAIRHYNYVNNNEISGDSTSNYIALWYQFSSLLWEYIIPVPDRPASPNIMDLNTRDFRRSPLSGDKKSHKSDTMMAATVETVVEQLDLAPIILTERVIPAVARAITFTEPDSCNLGIQSSHPYIFSNVESFERNFEFDTKDLIDDYKEHQFNFDELPPQLKYLHILLKELSVSTHSVLQYYMLQSLYATVLNGDFLTKLLKDRRCFVYWNKQTNMISQMWELCNSEHSHISELSVPILLYCITLPSGFNVYSKILHAEFNSDDWKTRFLAVEKATVVLRFIDSYHVKKSIFVQAALAHTFCVIILAINDNNELIAQRATLYLGSVHDDSMKLLIRCLEMQFDNIATDRTIILRSLYQLHNSLSDRKILTWEFFLNRFEIFAAEAQFKHKVAERSYLKDYYSQLSIRLNTIRGNLPNSKNANSQTDNLNNFEEINRETIHLLIFLFMEFISRSDQAYPSDEKVLSRVQNEVFKHLCTQIGYHYSEHYFLVPARVLRSSPAFNAFLSNVAQFLDQNYKLGSTFVPNVVYILQYCASTSYDGMFNFQNNPQYSLWHLDVHARRCWLTAVLVFCYKYDYKKLPLSAYVIPLIKIVLNTLSGHLHLCHQIPPAIVMYSLDQSCFSQAGTLKSNGNGTPPVSPAGNVKVKKSVTNMETHWEESAAIERSHEKYKRGAEINLYLNDSCGSEDIEEEENESNAAMVLSPRLQIGHLSTFEPKGALYKALETKSKNTLKACGRIGCISYRSTNDRDISEFTRHRSTSSIKLPYSLSNKCLKKSNSLQGAISTKERKIFESDSNYSEETELMLPAPERLLPVGRNSQIDFHASRDVSVIKSSSSLPEKLDKKDICACPYNVLNNIDNHPSIFLQHLRNENGMPKYLNELCHSMLNTENRNIPTEDCVQDRCGQCGTTKEEYSCEELGLCIVVLGTFIHREPGLAAPMLHNILSLVARISTLTVYSWQNKSNIRLPGGVMQVSRQFLRIILHQFAPNGVFVQIFQMHMPDVTSRQFFKAVIQALIDFQDLSPAIPLVILLEVINSKKALPIEKLNPVLYNMANYLDCLITDAVPVTWNTLINNFDTFFHRIVLQLEIFDDLTPILKNIKVLLKIPNFSCKSILEPFSKVFSYGLRNFGIPFNVIRDICSLCSNAFSKEREKLMLTRIAALELVQALRFKITLPAPCILSLVQLLLQDSGAMLVLPCADNEVERMLNINSSGTNAGIAEVMRQYHSDIIDFITDFYTLVKVKNSYKVRYHGLNDDTLGGLLKTALSQYITLELSKGTNRENSIIWRMLPWLHNTTSQNQQISWDFSERSNHIRLLCWLLLGNLTNFYILESPCLTALQEISCNVINELQIIFVHYPDYSKSSVVYTSSLFFSFVFCQLWTVYLEQEALCHKSGSEHYTLIMNILFDFWTKVTPFILTLASHSKLMADTVNSHFVNVIEALLECHSSVLSKLLPLWNPVFKFYKMEVTKQINFRLQKCFIFPSLTYVPLKDNMERNTVLKWLHCLQFKMSQVELQAYQGTQFYSI